MTMLRAVVAEIIGMFVGDARLALAILATIAGAAVLIRLTPVDPLVGGLLLFLGCPILLIENVRRSARTRA